ncbi:MAG: ComF family protein [Elusimicrobia bacterium]|nr:ComF family protein [Elusimicrobiota bacterium]
MGMLVRAGRLLGHWLLPQTCAHCREDLNPDWSDPLCGPCRAGLPQARPSFCLRCAEPVREAGEFCRDCSGGAFACSLIRAAFLYQGPVPGLVHAFKYRGRRRAAEAAGRWMACLLPGLPELSGHDAAAPVPLHPRRLRERGYNQARLLALQVGAAAGLPVLDLLARVKPTRPQWGLGRDARAQNLAAAFQAGPAARGLSVLLVDDVCTSGASLESCAAALRRAGARRVGAFVFARQTLQPSEN